MFAHLNPHSSDFGDVCALYAPFLHQLIMQSSVFESGRPVLVVVCVVRKLRPCPSYNRRRDRINFVHWRKLYKGGGYQRNPRQIATPPQKVPKNRRKPQTPPPPKRHPPPTNLTGMDPTKTNMHQQKHLFYQKPTCIPHVCYTCGPLCTKEPIWLRIFVLKTLSWVTSGFPLFHHFLQYLGPC